MFTMDRFNHLPTIKQIMTYNPAYQFLTAVRNVSIYDTLPNWQDWVSLSIWAFGTFILGFLFFWRAEHKYVRLT